MRRASDQRQILSEWLTGVGLGLRLAPASPMRHAGMAGAWSHSRSFQYCVPLSKPLSQPLDLSVSLYLDNGEDCLLG